MEWRPVHLLYLPCTPCQASNNFRQPSLLITIIIRGREGEREREGGRRRRGREGEGRMREKEDTLGLSDMAFEKEMNASSYLWSSSSHVPGRSEIGSLVG